MVNPRGKMRRSQSKVRNYLLYKMDFDIVYFQQHVRHDTITFFQDHIIPSKDIFSIADGIAVKDGIVFFVQVKSNGWNKFKDFSEFCIKYKLAGLFFNVKDRKGVFYRIVTTDK